MIVHDGTHLSHFGAVNDLDVVALYHKTCGASGFEPLLVLDQSGILDLHPQAGHAVVGVQDVLCTAQSFHDMGQVNEMSTVAEVLAEYQAALDQR